MTVEFDTAAWERAVETEFARLNIGSEKDLVDLATDIRDQMRATAPVSTGKRIARRHARSSIEVKQGRDRRGFFADVGPTRKGFWLAFYEFGTSKQPPRPFMRPAFDSQAGAALDKFKDILAAGIKRAARKVAKGKASGR